MSGYGHGYKKRDNLEAMIFALGEWYSCRGLALVANSGISTMGFKRVCNGDSFSMDVFSSLFFLNSYYSQKDMLSALSIICSFLFATY